MTSVSLMCIIKKCLVNVYNCFPELNYKQNYEDPANKTSCNLSKNKQTNKHENCVVVWNLDYTLKQGFDFSSTLSACYLFIFLKLK